MMISNSVVTGALLILSISLWSCTTAHDDAVDCCLNTSNRPIPAKIVRSFTVQTGDGPCRIPATLFVTKKGLKLCAPFPSENNWVSKLIDKVLAGPAAKPRKNKGKKQKQQ